MNKAQTMMADHHAHNQPFAVIEFNESWDMDELSALVALMSQSGRTVTCLHAYSVWTIH